MRDATYRSASQQRSKIFFRAYTVLKMTPYENSDNREVYYVPRTILNLDDDDIYPKLERNQNKINSFVKYFKELTNKNWLKGHGGSVLRNENSKTYMCQALQDLVVVYYPPVTPLPPFSADDIIQHPVSPFDEAHTVMIKTFDSNRIYSSVSFAKSTILHNRWQHLAEIVKHHEGPPGVPYERWYESFRPKSWVLVQVAEHQLIDGVPVGMDGRRPLFIEEGGYESG